MATRIIFSHGNSFPASTYRVMLDNLRQRGFLVDAVEMYGHDPQYPVTNNWPHLVEQLADFARDKQSEGKPAFLVGHSLGGILSLMCAARHPELARGGALSPGRISQKRRHQWPDAQSALESFQQKKTFARWEPQVLRDYIDHGTHDADGQRVLSFDRNVETAIYNSLPHKLDSLLKRKPLKCPAAFIGGTHSVEMRQAGAELTHKVVKGRIMMLDGSHLFPMEKPLATAAAIEASLRNIGA